MWIANAPQQKSNDQFAADDGMKSATDYRSARRNAIKDRRKKELDVKRSEPQETDEIRAYINEAAAAVLADD